MIHYINPQCRIDLGDNDMYRVTVKAEISNSPPKNILRARSALLLSEAKKDPLLAMAFIHWMADREDHQSKNIRLLYKGYCKMIEDGNSHPVRAVCDLLLSLSETDPLVRSMCLWITLTLDDQPIPKRLQAAAKLIKTLLPSINETLCAPAAIEHLPVEEVILPGMNGKHIAFPDLAKFQGSYYACFREAGAHVGHKDEGVIRILKGDYDTKSRGWHWELSGMLSKEGLDLRDPKFFIDGCGTLRLMVGASIIDNEDTTVKMIPHTASMARNGWLLTEAESDPSCDGANGQWIWRVTWNNHDNTGYGLSYGQHSCVNVVATSEGNRFRKIASISLPPLTQLNEGTLRFKKNGNATALIRTRRNGIIAHASPSSGYAEWVCHSVPFRLGGPDFLIDEKRGIMWAATRHFYLNDDNTLDEATIIAKMSEDKLVPLLRLPSSYDCGYPGIVLEEDGVLTVIYYSSPTPSTSKVYICNIRFGSNQGLKATAL